jgi:hypothetical protein
MNDFGKEQFYIRKDSSFELLIYKKYLRLQNGQTMVGENKKFIGQLTLYLHDCPNIQEKLKETEYRKNSMENLFVNYYGCIGSGIKFQKKTEKVRVEFGVLAGISLTTLKFRIYDKSILLNTNYPVSVNFTPGLFLDIILTRNHGKWSICNEITYSCYKVSGHFELSGDSNNHSVNTTTIGYSYLKMNNMLRFKYPAGPFFIYVNAGISNGYAISEKNYSRTETTSFTMVTVYEGNAIKFTRKWELGLIGGIGVKYKRFSLEARYESGNGMSDLPNLTIAANRFYFLLGFRI